MAAPGQYATVEQLQARLGALRLSAMSRLEPGDPQTADFNTLLLAASSRMNDALSRARYAVPVDLALIADDQLRAQAQAQFAVICTTLAAWYMVSGNPDAPPGLKLAKSDADKWLEGLLDGTVAVAGLAYQQEAVAANIGGRIGAVLGDDDNLGAADFATYRRLNVGGGFAF